MSERGLRFERMQKLQETIKADNARFEALSPEHKRVAIALDVLDQLRLGLISAIRGTYFFAKFVGPVSTDEEMQSLLASSEECHVCACGGLFVAMVQRMDQFKPTSFEHPTEEDDDGDEVDCADRLTALNTDFDKYLGGLFSQEQLALIEQAFEHWPFQSLRTAAIESGDHVSIDLVDQIFDSWALPQHGPATRMRLVMENIIVGNGSFNPWLTPKFFKSYPYIPGFDDAHVAARGIQGPPAVLAD